MNERLTLHFDGGSRGNPGIAGTGVVVAAEDGTPLITIGRYIGRATNNVAEYSALIDALRQAKTLKATKIIVRGDSELVIKQMRGEYRVKNPGLKPLYAQAAKLAEDFESVEFIHNLRHENSLADRLANLAMDRKMDVTDPGELTHTSPAPAQERNRIVCPNCGTEIDIDDTKH